MIQRKNTVGCGVLSTSRYSRPAATSATNAATRTYSPVWASPQAPSPAGARIGILSVHRQIKMPTRAISAATMAVATAPAQNRPESGRKRGLPAPSVDAGYVMVAPRLVACDVSYPCQFPETCAITSVTPLSIRADCGGRGSLWRVPPSHVLAQVKTERPFFIFEQIFATGLHLWPNCA